MKDLTWARELVKHTLKCSDNKKLKHQTRILWERCKENNQVGTQFEATFISSKIHNDNK